MRHIKIVIIMVVVCISLVKSNNQRHFSVDREGRPIQVDALLIEWKEEDTDTLEGDFLFTHDAMNTSLGIAGYVRFQYRDTCPFLEFRLYTKTGSGSYMSIKFDTASARSPLYAVQKSASGNDTSITAEWQVPWNSISVGSGGIYEIKFAGFNARCDTVKQFILSGKHEIIQMPSGTIVTRRIIIQVISIALMFVIFVVLKAKATKLKKR